MATEFERRLKGATLLTAEVLYYMPDHPSLLQSFMWQLLDEAPRYPRLAAFLDHWRREIEAVIGAMNSPSINGLLMRNHGLITVGKTMKEAYYRTEVVEDAARVFWIARSMGTPRVLSEIEAEEILGLEAERFRQRLLQQPIST